MEGVTALVAGLLTALHRSLAPDFCPGGWPWAVSMLGVVVGLLPAVGAVLIALLRKVSGNTGSVLFAAIGFVFAGLVPLVVFAATGRIFAAAAAGTAVPGLARTGLRTDACFAVVGSQADYLGRGTVASTASRARAPCASASAWSGWASCRSSSRRSPTCRPASRCGGGRAGPPRSSGCPRSPSPCSR